MMENVMINISPNAEQLLGKLGVTWNGWQYEVEDFIELNLELEANGVPTYNSFEEYLESRIAYKERIAA
jgi:hypothetical protein